MHSRSPALCALVGTSWLSLAVLNPISMRIGLSHGSVLRVGIVIGRPALVWAVELLAWRLSGGCYGEQWSTGGRSWVELAGFATIFAGFVLYCHGGRVRAARMVDARDGEEPSTCTLNAGTGANSVLSDSDCTLEVFFVGLWGYVRRGCPAAALASP